MSRPPAPDDTFDVLHALRVKGFASITALSSIHGRSEPEVTAMLAALHADELVSFRDGRVSGWRLTPAGTAAHGELLDRRRVDRDHALHDLHREFVPLNSSFKVLCTSWQMRGDEPNDHTDAQHDRMVVDGVRRVHQQIEMVFASVTVVFERSGWYVPRLRDAHDRFVSGDHTALTRPLSDSYHDVWMELHQDLILTLGLVRTDADS